MLAFAVNVNFQPAASAVPGGYAADTGATYANRGNGFTYGWNADNSAATRERNATADQKYDTLIHTASRSWEIAVPNGSYDVKLVAGDASFYDSTYAYNAEGVLTVSGTPSSSNHFLSGSKTVTVNDGKLTITNGAGAVNNKLAFLEITDAGDPPSPPPPPPPPGVPSLPATVQAEDFVSFFDTTSANLGGQYRSTGVDIVAASEGGYAVGYTRPTEWLGYSINNPSSGTFTLEARYAVGGNGGAFHVELDGANVTGAINVSNTGGWQMWKTLSRTGIAIGAGQHTLRVAFDKSNTSGADILNLNWLKLTAGGNVTPTLSIAATDATAAEPSNTGRFTITRTGSTAASLLVSYAIAGTAGEGVDYNTLAGSVTIPAGASSATITITPKDDAIVENNESVILSLLPTAGYNLGTSSATVTIGDNDAPQPVGNWPTTASWTRGVDFPRERHEARGGEMDGKIWVFGGFYSNAELATRQIDYYDIAANKWVTLKNYGPMPETHSAAVIDRANHAFYFVGGLFGNFQADTASAKVFKFDTITQTWSTPFPDMPEATSTGGAAIIDGKLHYIAGSKADRITDSGRHLVLDLSNPSAGWTDEPALPNARCHFSTAVLDGKLYIIGGQHDHELHTGQLADVHRYDPATRQWEKLADLPTPKSHAESSTFVLNGRIIMAGGQVGRFDATDEVVSYNPATNAWTTLPKLPTKLASGFVQPSGKRLVELSGNHGTSTPSAQVWLAELT